MINVKENRVDAGKFNMFNKAWGSAMVKMQRARKATVFVTVASNRYSTDWKDSQNAG